MWDLWLTNWHCDSFPPVDIIPPMLHIPYSFIPNINLAIEGIANNIFLLPYLDCPKSTIGCYDRNSINFIVSNIRAVFD